MYNVEAKVSKKRGNKLIAYLLLMSSFWPRALSWRIKLAFVVSLTIKSSCPSETVVSRLREVAFPDDSLWLPEM